MFLPLASVSFVISSRFIHFIAGDNLPCPTTGQCSFVSLFSFHLLVDNQIYCALALVNKGVVNTGMQSSLIVSQTGQDGSVDGAVARQA